MFVGAAILSPLWGSHHSGVLPTVPPSAPPWATFWPPLWGLGSLASLGCVGFGGISADTDVGPAGWEARVTSGGETGLGLGVGKARMAAPVGATLMG